MLASAPSGASQPTAKPFVYRKSTYLTRAKSAASAGATTSKNRCKRRTTTAKRAGTLAIARLLRTALARGTIVEIVVSPRVGPVEGAAVTAAVYDWLQSRPGQQLMADFWRDANTVRVVRRAPYATGAAKVLPLHRRASGKSAAADQGSR